MGRFDLDDRGEFVGGGPSAELFCEEWFIIEGKLTACCLVGYTMDQEGERWTRSRM